MPKGAYQDLMDAVKSYEKSGAADRDRERKRREDADATKRAQEEEQRRLEREGRDATGARVRQGFQNQQEMRDAVKSDLPKASDELTKKKRQTNLGAPRG